MGSCKAAALGKQDRARHDHACRELVAFKRFCNRVAQGQVRRGKWERICGGLCAKNSYMKDASPIVGMFQVGIS